MPGYDWRTSGESSGGTSYPVSRPSHHAPSQPPDRNQGGPPSVLNPPPPSTQVGYVDPGGNDEKTDYFDETYVSPQTGKTVKTMQDEAYAASQAQEAERMKQMNVALKTQQLHGGATGNINKWSDQELMQAQEAGLFSGEASGMLGGVTGYEKEVNKLKKAIASHMGKKATQGINPKKGLELLPEFKALMKLQQKTGEEPNPTLAVVNAIGVENAIKYGIIDPNDPATKNFLAQTTGDIGYDPTGRYNWAEDIEGRRNPETGEWEQTELGKVHDKFLSEELTPDEIRQDAHFLDYGTADPNQGGSGYGYGKQRLSQRDRNLALLQYLNKGLPIKQLEKSGFMASMKDPYAESTERTRREGIFKDVIPSGAFTPKAMTHLIKTYASGRASPRYANRARGGIMSAWNDMRR